MLALAERDALPHFTVDPERMDAAADLVADVTRAAYPNLAVPHHAAGGISQPAASIAGARSPATLRTTADRARSRVRSLRRQRAARRRRRRRLGLQRAGPARASRARRALRSPACTPSAPACFRRDPRAALRRPTRRACRASTRPSLGRRSRSSAGNPLLGLEGRVALMHGLARRSRRGPSVRRTTPPRIGGLLDHLRREARTARLPPRRSCARCWTASAPIWPARCIVDGVSLGDVWPHPPRRATAWCRSTSCRSGWPIR